MDIISKSWLTTKIKIPVRFPSFWINIKLTDHQHPIFFCQKCCRCRRRLRLVIALDDSFIPLQFVHSYVFHPRDFWHTYLYHAHAREWVIFVTWWESQTRYYLRLLIIWGDAHTHAPAHPLICDKGFVILLGYITTSESRNVSSPIVRRWCK
jgi:hypothetical protein